MLQVIVCILSSFFTQLAIGGIDEGEISQSSDGDTRSLKYLNIQVNRRRGEDEDKKG